MRERSMPKDANVQGSEAEATDNTIIPLPTPALTPISEHGNREPQALLDYEADDEGVLSPIIRSESALTNLNELPPPRPVNEVQRKSSSVTSNTSKLSPQQIQELVSSPESLPVRTIPSIEDHGAVLGNASDTSNQPLKKATSENGDELHISEVSKSQPTKLGQHTTQVHPEVQDSAAATVEINVARPGKGTRSTSTPLMNRRRSTSVSRQAKDKLLPASLKTDAIRHATSKDASKASLRLENPPSPLQQILPLPPPSLPTYLQLELSSERPSALYLHRPASADIPYESSKVKFERLQDFLLLPGFLEQVLWFGAVACLDAWLYTFTILPLRFAKALAILGQWWIGNAFKEMFDLLAFVYDGSGRVWQRRNQHPPATPLTTGSRRPSVSQDVPLRNLSGGEERKLESFTNGVPSEKKGRKASRAFRHRRTRSTPSALRPNHKADLLQGFLIAVSSYVLMWFDASRMYHNIRGQSAIKLYVIYNVLEVLDRLFSALGQDILECLFSKETLERDEDGRSKVIRPFWMFILALIYNVVHSTALFYQVVTLNVAVNSYSNALLTLLMSNQFVEIKGTVFKKFEKENLFQLTCADVVERFQLWLMLLIIALRNIVEVGGLSISLGSALGTGQTNPNDINSTTTNLPLMGGIMIPKAFTLMPKWTGEVLGPFLIVLGSEMLVDWCKHAYISKFNNIKPNIYGRFFDVLAKDYYSHAFADQNLTKRLGLPVIPLSCLFIRASVQTYYMFLATHFPPFAHPASTSLSLESEAASTSPATIAAIKHIDHLFRHALGHSSFGAGVNSGSFTWWSIDDLIALGTMVTFFLALYFLLLACKLVLGMCLLSVARNRYQGMKEREHAKTTTDGRRFGGWGAVEVSDDKRRWIYEDDPDSLRQLREKEEKNRSKTPVGDRLDTIDRYAMVAKRIW